MIISDDHHSPYARQLIAETAIKVPQVPPHIITLASDIEHNISHDQYWMPKLSALKNLATETALITVQNMLRVSGGRTYSNHHKLARLLRDVQ